MSECAHVVGLILYVHVQDAHIHVRVCTLSRITCMQYTHNAGMHARMRANTHARSMGNKSRLSLISNRFYLNPFGNQSLWGTSLRPSVFVDKNNSYIAHPEAFNLPHFDFPNWANLMGGKAPDFENFLTGNFPEVSATWPLRCDVRVASCM